MHPNEALKVWLNEGVLADVPQPDTECEQVRNVRLSWVKTGRTISSVVATCAAPCLEHITFATLRFMPPLIFGFDDMVELSDGFVEANKRAKKACGTIKLQDVFKGKYHMTQSEQDWTPAQAAHGRNAHEG